MSTTVSVASQNGVGIANLALDFRRLLGAKWRMSTTVNLNNLMFHPLDTRPRMGPVCEFCTNPLEPDDRSVVMLAISKRYQFGVDFFRVNNLFNRITYILVHNEFNFNACPNSLEVKNTPGILKIVYYSEKNRYESLDI